MGFGHLHGIQKVSLVDCPGSVSSVLFFGGCNLRCPYCHNPALVLDPDSQPTFSFNYFIEFLQKRQGLVDVIVFSGGEPTLVPDLKRWLEISRKYGFKTKLDTNGQSPDIVESVLDLLDYVGLDFKADLDKLSELSLGDPEKWLKTLTLITNTKQIKLDVRTTCHPLIQEETDFYKMAEVLKTHRVSKWYLQQFHDVETLGLIDTKCFDSTRLKEIAADLTTPLFCVKVRGV